jgi:hypothetical protein
MKRNYDACAEFIFVAESPTAASLESLYVGVTLVQVCKGSQDCWSFGTAKHLILGLALLLPFALCYAV